MPNTTKAQHPLPALARFCASCAGTLACWCLWLGLAGVLGGQLYIALAHRLPVPQLILHRLDRLLATEDLAVDFARAQFDPTGRILLESARLRVLRFEDPLVLAGSVYVRRSPWAFLSGSRAPDEIRIDGATVQLPAPVSPAGVATPLLSDACAVIRLDGPLLHLDQLTFRLGSLAVQARGTYHLRTSAPRSPAPLGASIDRVLLLGQQLLRHLPSLDAVENPRLNVVLTYYPGIGNVAELELTADALHRPLDHPLESGPLRLATTLRLDGEEARPLRVQVALDSLSVTDRFASGSLQAVITTTFSPRQPAWPDAARLTVRGTAIDAFRETLRQPSLQIDWQRHAPLRLELATQVHGETLVARARADLAARTAEVEFQGIVTPSLAAAHLPTYAPKVAPYLRFLDPLSLRSTATFGTGWQFEILRSRVRAGRVDSNGVAVSSLRGRIDFDRQLNFSALDARVTAGTNHARGSYWMNFRSWDYRYLLEGSMQPLDIVGWIRGQWWRDFWRTISFPAEGPDADVDVTGNYRDATRTTYFGRTDVTRALVLGADFAPAHARVFVRPHFAHAFDVRLTRADGQQHAEGWFKRRSDPLTRELRTLELDFQGQLDSATLAHLGGPPTAALLEAWKFGPPPTLSLTGHIDYRNGQSSPHLKFSGEADGPVSYLGFPLQKIRAVGSVAGPVVALDQIEATVAGGRGTAKAHLDGEGDQRRLGFDLYVESADLVQAIRAINEYEAARTPGEPPTSPNAQLMKRASGGRLNFALSAQGHPADLASFDGSGNLEVAGAELGEVHLFGLLSQLLSSFSLNFSSLKLDTLHGNFNLAAGNVTFPNIKVTGPNSLIEGKGHYRLIDRTLDFTARFKPYEQNRNLVTGVIGIVLNPLAGIIELHLTGPLAKPAWSFTLGASGARETTPPAPTASAPQPATPPPAN